jgi:hypothetical protein
VTEPEVPVVHTLLRPISMARIQTIDWDELRDLAVLAEGRADTDGTVDTDYARGVHDALRWLADGVPTTALLQLLGGR